MTLSTKAASIGRKGMSGDLDEWIEFNIGEGMQSPEGRKQLAAFPPLELMQVTTGLTDPQGFAEHGAHFAKALALASPKPLKTFESILDFGSGVGRLARMFKGFKGNYTGVDVDPNTVEWVEKNLPYVKVTLSKPRESLPFEDGAFDGVFSISVFTHMKESDQFFYLDELKRVSREGALLLLTVHGRRALDRALDEDMIFEMLDIPMEGLNRAEAAFKSGDGFAFIRQEGHLTSDAYEYGITFTDADYIRRTWGERFKVLDVVSGGLHDFQDIVVLERR